MKQLTLFIACSLMLSGVGLAEQLVPSERTAIFPKTKAPELIRMVSDRVPPGITGYWTPSEKDLAGVEDTLIAYLRSQKVAEKKDWKEYRRQVAGVMCGEGTCIFIYYFYYDRGIAEDLVKQKTAGYDSDSWRRMPHVVDDGGEAFFRVLYDLQKKRFVWYECNGLG